FIADLNVRLDITHPRVSDLYIHLQAPNGTDIVLFNRMGGASANLSGTLFDDQATQYIGFGRGPFTGAWQPALPLRHFNGKDLRGTWKLWVEDRGGVNQGRLNSWSLIVTPS